jgi:hypothetical protein
MPDGRTRMLERGTRVLEGATRPGIGRTSASRPFWHVNSSLGHVNSPEWTGGQASWTMTEAVSIQTFSRLILPSRNSKMCSSRKLTGRPLPGMPAKELITHLERHGYLTREPDPRDVRARVIRLTDRGRELENGVIAASARLHLAWREELGAEAFDVVWSALRQLTGSSVGQPTLTELRRDARKDGYRAASV